jgi:hypothetical protein
MPFHRKNQWPTAISRLNDAPIFLPSLLGLRDMAIHEAVCVVHVHLLESKRWGKGNLCLLEEDEKCDEETGHEFHYY